MTTFGSILVIGFGLVAVITVMNWIFGEKECRACRRTFTDRHALNDHIARSHHD